MSFSHLRNILQKKFKKNTTSLYSFNSKRNEEIKIRLPNLFYLKSVSNKLRAPEP